MSWLKTFIIPLLSALVPIAVKDLALGWFSAFTPYMMMTGLLATGIASGYGVHKFDTWWYNTTKLEAQNKAYSDNAAKLKKLLGLNDKADVGNADVEQSNQEILDELAATKRKADKPAEVRVVEKQVEVPASCPSAKPHPACLTDAGMRKLAKLR